MTVTSDARADNGGVLPGEIDGDGRTPRRRIMMHEFLMTGGTQKGYVDGKMAYSGPVSPSDYHDCPWHGTDCWAWVEIREGRGEWTRMEAELATARTALAVESSESQIKFIEGEISRLKEKLEMRPIDAKALRDRTPEEIAKAKAASKKSRADFALAVAAASKTAGLHSRPGAAKIAVGQAHAPKMALRRKDGAVDEATVLCQEHAGHKNDMAFDAGADTMLSLWHVVPGGRFQCKFCEAKAPARIEKVKKTGNPWDKPSVNTSTGEVTGSWRDDEPMWNHDYADKWSPRPVEPLPEDSRDLAMDAFAGESVPDTIEIDGDEGEED